MTTIKLRHSTTTSQVPASLVVGEVAINEADQKFFHRSAAGAVVSFQLDRIIAGPASSTDNAIVRFDGTTGRSVQNSGIIIDDSNNITGAASISGTGLTLNSASAGIELGQQGSTNTPFVDFHSSSSSTDYDARLIASGGTGSAGQGTLTLTASIFSMGGEIRASGNVIAYYSDVRLKNVGDPVSDALSKINSLDAIYYTPNELAPAGPRQLDVGLLAQQVQRILPEAIAPAPFDIDEYGASKSGKNYLTIKHDRLVPLLVAAIKELSSEVDVLNARLLK